MKEWLEYKSIITSALNDFTFDDEIVISLQEARDKNQKIFVAGNGGSAGIANHYVCDFSKGANENWKNNPNRFQAICLSSNIGYLTAIANDANYNEIFKEQLVNLGNPSDLLILISSSGNSPNIINAAKYAKNIGMNVIGITGLKGGELKKIADYSAHVNTELYESAEDIASIFGHFISWYFREKNKDISIDNEKAPLPNNLEVHIL